MYRIYLIDLFYLSSIHEKNTFSIKIRVFDYIFFVIQIKGEMIDENGSASFTWKKSERILTKNRFKTQNLKKKKRWINKMCNHLAYLILVSFGEISTTKYIQLLISLLFYHISSLIFIYANILFHLIFWKWLVFEQNATSFIQIVKFNFLILIKSLTVINFNCHFFENIKFFH